MADDHVRRGVECFVEERAVAEVSDVDGIVPPVDAEFRLERQSPAEKLIHDLRATV